MKTYEQLKKELQDRRHNIKGFNRAFYKTFSHDMDIARKGVEEARELGVNFSIGQFWDQSETHKTWFYQYNGGAYCELLSIME